MRSLPIRAAPFAHSPARTSRSLWATLRASAMINPIVRSATASLRTPGVLQTVTLCAVAVYLLIRAVAYAPVRDQTERQLVVSARQQSHLLESLRGIQSLKVAGHETSRRSAYDNLMVDTVNHEVRLAHVGLGFSGASQLVFGIERVAALASRWADEMQLPAPERDRVLRAVWLHDALRDAEEADMRWLAPEFEGPADLLHGPAAARRAAQEGETDLGVLAAVRWHSLGSPEWDHVGRMLYCADFLEPGRKHDPGAAFSWPLLARLSGWQSTGSALQRRA